MLLSALVIKTKFFGSDKGTIFDIECSNGSRYWRKIVRFCKRKKLKKAVWYRAPKEEQSKISFVKCRIDGI